MATNLCEDCQMLILYQRGSVRGQPSLLKIRKHVEEMHRSNELDDGVAQELEPLVVFHLEDPKTVISPRVYYKCVIRYPTFDSVSLSFPNRLMMLMSMLMPLFLLLIVWILLSPYSGRRMPQLESALRAWSGTVP